LQLCKINCNETYQENCDNCNLCHLLNTEQLPSFIVIRPDGSTIKKEQVLELKQKFSTMPIYSKYNIYAILNSEKLNSSSANTLLKFIEEPERGIIGFFITNNKENINKDKLKKEVYNSKKESKIILDLKKFNMESIVIQKRIILNSIQKIFGTTKGIEKIHLDDMIKLCNNNIGNKFLTPNKNLKIVIKNKQIHISDVK